MLSTQLESNCDAVERWLRARHLHLNWPAFKVPLSVIVKPKALKHCSRWLRPQQRATPPVKIRPGPDPVRGHSYRGLASFPDAPGGNRIPVVSLRSTTGYAAAKPSALPSLNCIVTAERRRAGALLLTRGLPPAAVEGPIWGKI